MAAPVRAMPLQWRRMGRVVVVLMVAAALLAVSGSAPIRNAGPVDTVSCKFYLDDGSG